MSGQEVAGGQTYDELSRRADGRLLAGRTQRWWEKRVAKRDAHDWLYAAARKLLDQGHEQAARIVMDFADEEVAPHVR